MRPAQCWSFADCLTGLTSDYEILRFALDYDGTIAENGKPHLAVMQAI